MEEAEALNILTGAAGSNQISHEEKPVLSLSSLAKMENK